MGIHRAAAAGDVEKIRGVHKKAPDAINLPDANGWNAIHEASRGGHLEAVKYLVNNGADVGARTGTYISSKTYILNYSNKYSSYIFMEFQAMGQLLYFGLRSHCRLNTVS